MTLETLLKKLERIKNREGDHHEIRIGGYAGSTSIIEGAYFDEDNNNIIIY